MKFQIYRASHAGINSNKDYQGPEIKRAYKETQIPYEGADEVVGWYVDINTLEELMALNAETGCDLIINSEDIWIYDDYME